MKISKTFSISLHVAEKLPELRKKVIDLNEEVETCILKLMRKHNIDIKIK